MKFLVTGGAGFIGSHLCERLLADGHAVVCLDNFSTGSRENLKPLAGKPLTVVEADVRDRSAFDAVFSQHGPFDGIFHYAALVGVERTLRSPIEVLQDIDGTKNLFELALLHGKPKIVYASSSEVYGEPVEIPEVENGHVNAKLPYAVAKLVGEKYVESYWEKHQLPACALRFFNVFGPRQESSSYGFVVGIFIKQVISGQRPTVFGDGTQTRDFVYIDDNIEAAVRAMLRPETNGQVLNVGSGRPMTILDLAEDIIEIADETRQLVPDFAPTSRQDVRHRFPDISKMKRLLDFKPRHRIREGLEKTIAWYRRQPHT